jgi:hypothetical protein
MNDDMMIWIYGYFSPSKPSVGSTNLSLTPYHELSYMGKDHSRVFDVLARSL